MMMPVARPLAFLLAIALACPLFALTVNPPRASRIEIGEASLSSGEATIRGEPGAVDPGAWFIAVTMETGHYTIGQASSDGSFTASLFAPPGASVLIKSDRDGTQLPAVLSAEPVIDHHFSELTSLPGTIVRASDPPAEVGLAFGIAGIFRTGDRIGASYAPWSAQGAIPKSAYQAGETLDVRLTLTLFSATASATPARVRMQLSLVPVTQADGTATLTRNSFFSTRLTPTGLPIQRSQWPFTYYQSGVEADLLASANGALRAELQSSLRIREDLAAGCYRPVVVFTFENISGSPISGIRLVTFIDGANRSSGASWLPIIRIGDPSPPRLPLAVLMNAPIQGTRGAVAIEDRERMAIAPHVITSPERILLPRLDRDGNPTVWNLEPFAPILTLGDRGSPPSPPLVPFRLGTGQLTATIRGPSGSVTTIGPAGIEQVHLISALRQNGSSLEGGGPSMSDPCQITTLDSRFDVSFPADGAYRLTLDATLTDLWGNAWVARGTWDIDVGRPLAIDPFLIPGTPLEVGGTAVIGAVLQPPVPADVEIRIVFAPRSDATRRVSETVPARANRFGYVGIAQRPRFDEEGEYRIDLFARHVDPAGRHWVGSMTYGGVVAPKETPIIAHGRRGIDDQQENRQAWFFRSDTGLTFGRGHVHIPFHSGDVMWMEEPDAATPVLTFQDPGRRFVETLRQYCCGGDMSEDRVQAGEIPLFSGNLDGLDVHLSDAMPDFFAHGYAYVERPGVRVREIIAEQVNAYWRFNDPYGLQLGTGIEGDLPNDVKFQFAGIVLGGKRIGGPFYAIYGSFFVLVPETDEGGGTRIFPPFQGNGGGPSGGPLFTLKGKDVDLFFHPTGLRPGSILHRGERVSFAGYSAPTLPSNVEIVVSSPSGATRTIRGQANRIGYFHDPASDFTVGESGVWKAKVRIVFDGRTSAGQVSEPFPSGDILGSREGEFNFYVVDANTPQLEIAPMPQFVRPADGAITFAVVPPAGLSDVQLTRTTTMPAFILEESTSPSMTYRYDAPELAKDFPNLDLHDADGLAGVDPITISFLLSGTDASGARKHFARQVVIQGEEVQMPQQPPRPRRRAVR